MLLGSCIGQKQAGAFTIIEGSRPLVNAGRGISIHEGNEIRWVGFAMVDGIPKYVSVRDHLRGSIKRMKDGAQLPTESELCTRYNVSRITVRHAIEDLIREGLIVRSQGKGTFKLKSPSSSREVINGHIRGFWRQQRDLGKTVKTRVLGNRIVKNADFASKLGIDADADLIELERLRYVDGNLHQYVCTYLSAVQFPEILEHDFSDGSLYSFIEEQYDVRLARNEVVVRIENVDSRIAGYFHVDRGRPVLAMDSTVFDGFGSVVAFGIALQPPAYSEIEFVINSMPDSR